MATEIEEIILKVGVKSDLTKLNKDLSITNSKLTKTSKLTGKINKNFAALGAVIASAIAIKKLIELGREAIKTSREFERMALAMETVFGRKMAKNILFIRKESERLGIDVMQASKGFVSLAAATKGVLSVKETEKLFTATAEASTALGLSADKTASILTALSQIASKGTLSAEELRQQIGEHLPGAFKIAADGMGLTTKELTKLMETGKVSARDFLVPWTEQLTETFHGGAMKNANSEIAESIRNMNRWNLMLNDAGVTMKTVTTPAFSLFLSVLEDFTPFESTEKVLKDLEKMNAELDKINTSQFRKQTEQSPLERSLFAANELVEKFRENIVKSSKADDLRKSLGLTELGFKKVKNEIDELLKSDIPFSELNKKALELIGILKDFDGLTENDIIKTDDVKKAEKIKEMLSELIGDDFLKSIESATGVDLASIGQTGDFAAREAAQNNRGRSTTESALEVGTAEAAKFLSRPLEAQADADKKRESQLEEIKNNTKVKPIIFTRR